MNDALCRAAWDKGCTDIMYMTIEYQTTQLSPFLHNQGEIVWTCCDWEFQVSTLEFELVFSPPQLDVLPLSYDARSHELLN